MLDDTHKTHKKHITGQQELESCSAITYQSATVCVPVTVDPKVNTGEVAVYCCDEPIITPFPCTLRCNPKKNGSCYYTITQNICIEIPVVFSADAFLGKPCIDCGEVTGQTVCKDSGK